MTIVMITGGIDISVGSVVAMVHDAGLDDGRGEISERFRPSLSCWQRDVYSAWYRVLVAYLKIQPFIVTLAGTCSLQRGTTSIISQEMISITNGDIYHRHSFKMYLPFGGYLNKKGSQRFIPLRIPHSVIIALVVLAIVFVVLKSIPSSAVPFYAIGGMSSLPCCWV